MADEGRAWVLSIGDELLAGTVLDTNLPHVARELAPLGWRVVGASTVRDDEEEIARAVREALARAELVVATGGLGPTRDDLTREGIARALGAPLEESAVARASIEAWLGRLGRRLGPENAPQTLAPRGAEVVPNPVGTAPALWVRSGDRTLVALPGVPREMEHLLAQAVLPRLARERPSGACVLRRRIHLFGLTEAAAGARLAPLMARDRNPRVGITVKDAVLTVSIEAAAAGAADARARLAATEGEVRALFGDRVFGEDGTTLAAAAAEALLARRLSVALAESATGGLVGHLLTEVPGVSGSLRVDVVAYANEMKRDLLAVPQATLDAHGAVSAETAAAMAAGARRAARADLAAATTGIAGPGGATPEKPVGLVFVAVDSGGGAPHVERHVLAGNRSEFKVRAAMIVLDRLRRAALGLPLAPA